MPRRKNKNQNIQWSPRRMGFQLAEKLSDNDNIEEVVQKLFDERAGFELLLKDDNLSGDYLVLIVHMLSKVSKSTFVHTKVQIYQTVFTNSNYIKQLKNFIASSPYHDHHELRRNRHFWSDSEKFWCSIGDVFRDMTSIPSLASQVLPKLLESIVITLPILENQQNIHISDDIKDRFRVLLQIIKNIESEMVKTHQYRRPQVFYNGSVNEDDWIPPDDFRNIDVYPDLLEVGMEQKPFLRKNKTVGAYKNIDHYLDVQFRLLREDFISPVREGICQYLKKPNEKRYDNIDVYPKVHFLSKENERELQCFRVKFDLSPKKKLPNSAHSDPFMFGSLVCFSDDRFLSAVFGKIVNSSPEMIRKGEVIVELHEYENISIDYDSDYTMIESKVYFEPYFHVLKALQNINQDNFPFARYLVQAKANVYSPEYINNSTRFTIDDRIINLTNWSFLYQLYGLNESQENALRASLTREISIIQGPPGTGKTFLGLKIAHTLLMNKDCWYKKTPLLVICFTNHALDQFLEGVLKSTTNLLRIGGQSKNAILQNYNFAKNRKRKSGSFYQARRQVTLCLQDIKAIDDKIDQIVEYDNVIDFSFFREFLSDLKDTWFYTARKEDMKHWLCQDVESYKSIPVINNYLSLETLKTYILKKKPFEMTMTERRVLYKNLRTQCLQYLKEKRKHLKHLYRDKYKIYTEQRNIEDVMAMRDSLVIGMTTTSAARLRPVLQALKSPIVIVEEAAEVLESHIIAALTGHCKQLILLGDHKQLRPSTSDYTIETDYQMGVSLFERMILNKIQCHTLNVQHRMRPEICNLIRPHIYSELTDAPGAFGRPEILGVDKSLFFITHNNKEESHGDTSKKNSHEATFLISLAKYLLLNGYGPEKVTILAAYSGQMLEMQKEKRKHSILEDVRISVLDNYQGEESDIILLSLVRNNKENKNGFLKNENRVCVALSRARNGLYIMGNMSQLCRDKDTIWLKIRQTLEQQNAIGTSLKLKCQIHGVITEVKNAVDFNKVPHGSCTIQCGAVLSCGHVCTDICHLSDRGHKNFTCREICGRRLCNRSEEHLCIKLCYKKCSPCHYTVRWRLLCDHLVTLKCPLDPNQYDCIEPCEALLDCGHSCTLICHERDDPGHKNFKCLKECERARNGCSTSKHKCRKLCHERCEPCQVRMKKQRTVCSHVHEVPCNVKVDSLQCSEPCSRILRCGHKCAKKCFELCGPCLVIVEKEVPECRHKIKIECHKEPKRQHCEGNCTRKLSCGHDCQNECRYECKLFKCFKECERTRIGCSTSEHKCRKLCHERCEPCQVRMKKQRTICSHVHEVPCNVKVDALQCSEPCSRILPCGHKCVKKCFELCGPCLVIVEKEVPECKHKIKIECYKEPKRQHCGGNCTRKLSCGHDCQNKCWEECTDKCLAMKEWYSPSICGHIVKQIECFEKAFAYDEVLLKYCTEPCQQVLQCTHKCTGTCGQCFQGRIHVRCTEKCGVSLLCNHECPTPCSEVCKPCEKKCNYKCEHAKCTKKCGEICVKCVEECSRRCVHQKCSQKCGDICDVKPCQMPCPKKLRCGHDCVGFCNDPCPRLCRTCDRDKVLEISFVTENIDGARFVELQDCGHVMESCGMESWLESDNGMIRMKVCPKCNASIINTQRYGDFVKRAFLDMKTVKLKLDGSIKENTKLLIDLLERTNLVKKRVSELPNDTLSLVICKLESRLQGVRLGDYRGYFALICILAKLQIVEHITDMYYRYDCSHSSPSSAIDAQCNFLLHPLLKDEGEITIQEIEDVQRELSRFKRMVEILQINKKYSNKIRAFFFWSSTPKILEKLKSIEKCVMFKERYSEVIDEEVVKRLKQLDSGVKISDSKRLEIVDTMDLSKGHWIKCTNGHSFVITKYGGANQEPECPDCWEKIQVTENTLTSAN